MGDDKARLPPGPTFLPIVPSEPDQRGAEDVEAQEGQQERERLAPVDPFLSGVRAVTRLEEGGVSQDGGQGRQAEYGELE